MLEPVFTCVPADELLVAYYTGGKKYTPAPGAVIRHCSVCGIDVWFGPNQQQAEREWNSEDGPVPNVECMVCTLKKTGPDYNVINLGGTESKLE